MTRKFRALLQAHTPGFTLLEMLFVLFVISLIFGLVVPRLGTSLDSADLHSQQRYLEDQLRQLPRRARLAYKALELPKDLQMQDMGDGAPPMEIPPNWTIKFSPSFLVSASGACSGSVVTIKPDTPLGITARYKITELSCAVTELPQ